MASSDQPPPTRERDDEDRYFTLTALTRYSGLSLSTLKRFLRDPEHPLPHHPVRAAGTSRPRVLIAKKDFDAWVRAFRPARPAGPNASWLGSLK